MFIYLNWRLATSKYCGVLCHIDKNQPQVHMCPPILKPPPTSITIQSLCVVPEHQL